MSDQIRYGRIVVLDAMADMGTILDENEQEIDFLLSEQTFPVSLDDRVSFIIMYLEGMLKVVGMKRVLYCLYLSRAWDYLDPSLIALLNV